MPDYTLHTHTIGFDGHNTAEDVILAARAHGFKTIGFSNHFIVHPDIYNAKMYEYAVRGGYANIYSNNIEVSVRRFANHYQDVRELRKKYPDMNILCGMEMDYFQYPEWAQNMAYAVRCLEPDYIIGATHFIEHPKYGIMNVHDMKNARIWEIRRIVYAYYDKLIEFSGLKTQDLGFRVNWIAHFDLPRKVGLHYPKAECVAIQAFAQNKIPIELNTALIKNRHYGNHRQTWHKIAELNIPIILSDDAHDTGRIGANFDEIGQMAQDYGIQNICQNSKFLCRFVGVKTR